MVKRGKKAQLTMFIILAILIVALALFFLLFWPKIKPTFDPESDNPYTYIQECIEEELEERVETITSNGGDYELNPGISLFHQGEYIKFLCYVEEYNELCHRQVIFLIPYIEREILESIEQEEALCFESLRNNYRTKGYDVELLEGERTFNIGPELIELNFNKSMTITRGNNIQKFDNFYWRKNSKLYDILTVSNNILDWEENMGDSLPEAYMIDDPFLRVEKRLKENDNKLYFVSHRETGEEFRFASRSLAAPPGI